MKRLLLITFLIIGCGGVSRDDGKVKVYTQADGKYCFYLENAYNNAESGIYCKQ